MDILKLVKEILAQQNPQEKDNQLEQLGQVLEYHYGLNEDEIVEGVRLLLAAALEESNKEVRETFFRIINTAVANHDIRTRIDWDRLVVALPSLGKWELESVLEILGISGQAAYLPALEEYTHHADPEIRAWARDAVDEINFQVAHASDAQKEDK